VHENELSDYIIYAHSKRLKTKIGG